MEHIKYASIEMLPGRLLYRGARALGATHELFSVSLSTVSDIVIKHITNTFSHKILVQRKENHQVLQLHIVDHLYRIKITVFLIFLPLHYGRKYDNSKLRRWLGLTAVVYGWIYVVM